MGTFNTQIAQFEDDAVDGALAADPGVAANAADVPPPGSSTSPPDMSDPTSDPRKPAMPDMLSSAVDTVAGIGSAGGSAPTGATPAASPAAPLAAPDPPVVPPVEPPPPPEVHTTTKSPEVTKHLVNKEEIKADAAVDKATEQGAKAIELENSVRLKEAESKALQADIDVGVKKEQQANAKARLDEANRRKAEIDADAAKKQAAYEDAAKNKDFWKISGGDSSDKNDIHNRQNWSLSLMFGNIAQALGGENVGRKLMDKTMSDWVTERDKNLARLERDATAAGGLKEKFWHTFGEDAKDQKELQDAAGYASVADTTEKKNEKDRAIIGEKAYANNQTMISDYRAKAALLKQQVVEKRFDSDKVTSGGTQTTTITGKAVAGAGGANGKAFGKQSDLAIYGTGVLDALKDADDAKLTPKQMQDAVLKYQKADNRLKGAAEEHGTGGAMKNEFLRWTGYLPKGLMSELSPAQQKWLQGINVASKKTATIIAGQGHANAHEMMESFTVKPDDSPEVVVQKVNDMRAFGAKAAALSPLTGKAQKAGDAARTPEAEGVARMNGNGASSTPSAVASPSAGGIRKTYRKDGKLLTGTLMPNGEFHAD